MYSDLAQPYAPEGVSGPPERSDPSGIECGLATCEQTLAELGAAAPAAFSDRLFAHLTARDALARALAGGTESPALADLRRVEALDEELRRIWAAHPGRHAVDLERWRALLKPPADAPWWRLDEAPLKTVWLVLTGFFVAAAISLLTDILHRLLSEGPDFLTVFSALSQAALTVLAGSTLTEAGRGALERFLARRGVSRGNRYPWNAVLAAVILLAILGFRFSLPALARLYNDRGLRQHDARQVSSAIESYRHAISLNPDNPAVHYNLGLAYEDVLDFGRAQSEYQLALQANTDEGYMAYNNLARIYLLRQNGPDAASALRLTTEGLVKAPDDPGKRYVLYKNRAWAYLNLNLPGQAQADLVRALALRPDGAAAHCLAALVAEAQGQPDRALPAWEDCIRFATPDEPVEPQWVAMARERLEGGPK